MIDPVPTVWAILAGVVVGLVIGGCVGYAIGLERAAAYYRTRLGYLGEMRRAAARRRPS